MPVATRLVQIAGAVAADRDADGRIDIARRQAVTRRACAIDVDLDGRLSERGKHRQVGDALHRRKHRLDLFRGLGERHQIVAEQLDRVLALHAGHRLGDVILQILREVELDAGEFGLQLRQQFRGDLILVMRARPLADRLERRKEFGIEQSGRVGAVVGPALLRHHRFHLGPRADHAPHLVDVSVAFFQ